MFCTKPYCKDAWLPFWFQPWIASTTQNRNIDASDGCERESCRNSYLVRVSKNQLGLETV